MIVPQKRQPDNAVAIIPARGGSKRIPRKNIRSFHGQPLIAYSIQVALESALFDKVIVSTDDEEIAQVARTYGAHVPFLRPSELADDHTGTGAVIDDALKRLEANGETYAYVCTLYATAPLLQAHYLQEGFEQLRDSTASHSFSATSMPFPIQRTFKITQEGRCEMFWPEHIGTRSQDLEEAYQDAGQFYWSRLGPTSKAIMFSEASIPIILPRYLVQDIDTPEDWRRAELMFRVLQEERSNG